MRVVLVNLFSILVSDLLEKWMKKLDKILINVTPSSDENKKIAWKQIQWKKNWTQMKKVKPLKRNFKVNTSMK